VELRGRYFTPPPADTIVEVSSLAFPEIEIETEAIAVADEAVERV
jgi:enamine deaminase RidA (YjgF/YER057c/UK114 family)